MFKYCCKLKSHRKGSNANIYYYILLYILLLPLVWIWHHSSLLCSAFLLLCKNWPSLFPSLSNRKKLKVSISFCSTALGNSVEKIATIFFLSQSHKHTNTSRYHIKVLQILWSTLYWREKGRNMPCQTFPQVCVTVNTSQWLGCSCCDGLECNIYVLQPFPCDLSDWSYAHLDMSSPLTYQLSLPWTCLSPCRASSTSRHDVDTQTRISQ